MILSGDIGGTNTRLAIFSPELKLLHEGSVKNAGHSGFNQIVRDFLAKAPAHAKEKFDRACFGVAGPVADGKVKPTNLDWQLDERELARELGISKVALVNDLVAHAEGIEVLQPEHFISIAAGEPTMHGNRAVIAAGTGLGEAGLVFDPDIAGYRAFASEGGHSDFSPRTDQDFALAKHIQQTRGVATWERVLSGPGLKRIFEFLGGPADTKPEHIASSTDPLAKQAIDLFVRYYAAEAGNLALRLLATGGVYISGSIAAGLVDRLRSDLFLQNFRDKGPDKLRPLMAKIPIHLVTLETCALHGAANYARRL
jgi:glucokinase